jgi:thiopeptide-type bacteriocin biosynthesis protein
VQLDTYEREVERYGGPEGIALAEALFHMDSEAVLTLLQVLEGDEGADMRWRLALVGMDRLLDDLGLPLASKAAVVGRARADLGAEFHVDRRFEEQLSARYRQEFRALEALLEASPQIPPALRPGLAALGRRSERLRQVAEALRHAEQEGRLTASLEHLAGSFLHMQANRLLQVDQRAQELILYDFLSRLYRSRQARMRGGGSAPTDGTR